MAKAAKPGRAAAGTDRLNATAEKVGAALGHFAARIDAWKQQREEIAGDLKKYVASAQSMLDALGHKATAAEAKAQKTLAAAVEAVAGGNRKKPGRRAGFKQSDEAKKKMRAAWKRRRQEMKVTEKGIGKKGTHAKREITKPITEKM